MEIIWKFNKPISMEEIVSFENETGKTLSEALKQCVLINNGGRPIQHLFDTDKESEMEIKRLLPFNKDTQESVYLFINILDENSIPFAITPSGDLIYEKKSIIYLWEHEKEESYQIADSFEKFLEKLY